MGAGLGMVVAWDWGWLLPGIGDGCGLGLGMVVAWDWGWLWPGIGDGCGLGLGQLSCASSCAFSPANPPIPHPNPLRGYPRYFRTETQYI